MSEVEQTTQADLSRVPHSVELAQVGPANDVASHRPAQAKSIIDRFGGLLKRTRTAPPLSPGEPVRHFLAERGDSVLPLGGCAPVSAERRDAEVEAARDATVFTLSDRVLLEHEDGGDGVVVIDGRVGTICTSNAAASLLLPLLKQGATATDLALLLTQRFALQPRDALEDVQVFLDQLSAMGFVESRLAGRDLKSTGG